jgi:hypothetical protein
VAKPMKSYKLTVFIEIDDYNLNAPSLETCKDYVIDSLNTPDNDHFGIKKIECQAEEVENF